MLWIIALASAQDGVEVAPPRSPWGVGLGVSSGLDAVRLAGTYALRPALNAELGVRVRWPTAEVVNSFDQVILGVSYEGSGDADTAVPETIEPVVVYAGVDWGFIPRLVANDFSGGPRLYGGVELRDRVTYRVTLNEEAYSSGGPAEDLFDLGEPSVAWTPALSLGAGVDAWYDGRFGARLRWTGAAFFAPEPTFGSGPVSDTLALTTDFTAGFDLLYAF